MAATTIGALSYQIIADTTKFSQGMQLTRNEIAAAKRALHDSKSVVEQYGLATDRLSDLLVKGAIDGKAYTASLNRLNDEFRELTGETAKAEAQARHFDRLIERGKQLFDSTRTAADRYNEELREMSMLLRRGVIDQEIFNRAQSAAQGRFNQAFIAGQTIVPQRPGIGDAVLGGAGRTVTGVLGGMGIALGVQAMTSSIVGLGKHTLTLAANMEQAQVSFKTMLGSADDAKRVLSDLQAFAAQTPFEFPDVTDAATKLVSFRIEQEKLMPTLKALGDVSAGLRIPLGELADIYGRQKSQGRLFAQDLNQFTGRGIPLIQELAKQFGLFGKDAGLQVRKLVEEGKVGFEHLEQALVSLTSRGGQFHNLMLEQSKTMSGLATTLKDEVNLSLTELGATINEELDLKEFLQGLRDAVEILNEEFLPAVKLGLEGVGGALDFVQGGYVEALRRWGQLTGDDVLVDHIENIRKIQNGLLPKPGDPVRNKAADPLHDPLAQDFAKEVVALERQRDAIGKSKLEVELMQLAQKGFNEEQLKTLKGKLEEIRLLETERELMKEEWDAFQKKQKEEEAKERRDKEQMKERKERLLSGIIEGNKTPQERAIEDFTNGRIYAKFFHDIGRIDDNTFGRELTRLQSELREAFTTERPRMPSRTAGAALERGSAEAFSAIMRAADRTGKSKLEDLPPIAKEQLQVSQQMLEQLRQGAGQVQVVENNF